MKQYRPFGYIPRQRHISDALKSILKILSQCDVSRTIFIPAVIMIGFACTPSAAQGPSREDGLRKGKDALARQDYPGAMSLDRKLAEDAKAALAQLQGPPSATAASVSLLCKSPKGTVLVSVDMGRRAVRVEDGMFVLEYKESAEQYVTVTEGAIEFGCRENKNATSPFCEVDRNRIDRRTGVWTALGGILDCSPAPTKRQF